PPPLRRARRRHRAGVLRPRRRMLRDEHRTAARIPPLRLPQGPRATRPEARTAAEEGQGREPMSFLTPLYILGALAVAAPIVFHLIRRTPKGEVPFSSLMFL